MLKIKFRKAFPVILEMMLCLCVLCGCGSNSGGVVIQDNKTKSSTDSEAVDTQNTEYTSDTDESEKADDSTTKGTEVTKENADDDGLIYVQVGGAVNNPGVYQVKNGLRIFEVLNQAGGVNAQADTDGINMTLPAEDQMMIYVPTEEEVANGYSADSSGNSSKSVSGNGTVNDTESTKVSDTENSLVNINTATIEQLVTLPGIGESKANSIINYRENNGDYKTIDDIMNVTGIKQAAFDKIKDYITV